MKSILKLLPILFIASNLMAIDRISLLVTVNNPPVTGNTLVINSSSRFATNAQTATTWLTNLTGLGPAATNLFKQITDNPYSGLSPQYVSTNSFRLVGSLGGALSASAAGGWATLTLSTQSGPSTFTALYPLENIVGETNRTNQASALVAGFNDYSTNAISTNSTVGSNFLHKGAGPRQYVVTEVQFKAILAAAFAQLTNANLVNSTNSGYVVSFRNGYWSNAIIDSLTVTNFRSPGNGSSSEKIGTSSTADGDFSFAAGASASANGEDSVALGFATVSSAFGSIALGATAEAININGISIGYNAASVYSNTVAIGAGSLGTTTNQIRLGTASETVSIPGSLEAAAIKSSTYTGTNRFDLAVSFSRTNITSLANGANDLDPGLKTYLRVSGPSGSYSIDKIDRGWDGRFLRIQKNDSFTLTILNDSGAGVLGDAAKIRTGTGGTITITNNPGVAEFTYDPDISRWVLGYHSN